MKKACYPGSFDPLSNGHLDIIKRASKIFDEVYVVVSKNIHKNSAFTPLERKEMILACVKDLKNVKVDIYDGLIVKYCKEKQIDVLIRGVRNIQDYEDEFNLFQFNKDIEPSVETFLMLPTTRNQIVSSSAIRELVHFDQDISNYVPHQLVKVINDRIKNKE